MLGCLVLRVRVMAVALTEKVLGSSTSRLDVNGLALRLEIERVRSYYTDYVVGAGLEIGDGDGRFKWREFADYRDL